MAKINIRWVRVVDSEKENVGEWFNLCDKVFKFIGWLLLSGAVFALWDRTKNIVFIFIFAAQSYFIGVLISKILLTRVVIECDGENKYNSKIFKLVSFVTSFIIFFGTMFVSGQVLLAITRSVANSS